MVAGFFEGTNNQLNNNLCNSTQFGATNTNGNQVNVNMSSVFAGPGTGISSDAQWKLKSGSPAIGAGFGSTTQNPIDAGIYGGQASYVLSGLPPIPAIYFFQTQPVGNNTNPISVTIKVKSVN